jgi:predicted nucleic acid-binding protein
LHKYSYVGADPVNFIDPSGLAETHEYGHNAARTKLCARLSVVLDANALIGALAEGALAEVDIALAGRQPLVPIRAAKEFLRKNSPDALRAFLSERGGRIARAGSQSDAKSLQDLARTLGKRKSKRVLKPKDAEVAASALKEETNVLTRDRKFRRFLRHANECGKILITGEIF